jgi:hypothetical protein
MGTLLALSACGSGSGPHTALSPIIPPGSRQMTACYIHHDLTLAGDTIDGRTGGIDVQYTATGPPDFAEGSPCKDTMLQSFVGDTEIPLSTIPDSDVLGCHLPLEDVYVAPGRDYAANLAAATIECQVIGTDGGGHPRWWGGVVSGIPEDRTPAPSPVETQGPLPAAGKVVCRVLFTMTPGSFDPSQPPARELVEGTSQKVCQSLSILNTPLSIMSGVSVTSVPGSFQRICDRRDAYVFAPSQEDDGILAICAVLAS